MSDTSISLPQGDPGDSGIADRLEEKMFGASDEKVIEKIEKKDDDIEGESEVIKIDDTLEDDDLDDGEDDDDDGDDDDADPETLAAYLGLDEDQVSEDADGKVLVATKVNGEIKMLPWKEVVNGFQMQSSLTQNQQKLADERKEFETIRKEQSEQINSNLQTSFYVLENMEKDLLTEYNAVNWDALRGENPGEYTALRQDYADKAKRVDGLKDKAKEAAKEFMTKQQEAGNAAQVKYVKEQHSELLTHVPEFTDEATYKSRMDSARAFATKTYGLKSEEMDEIFDNRLVRIILDAEKFHKGKTELKKKTSKKIPKFQKAGARQSRSSSSEKSTQRKRAALRKTGSTQDAANAILDRM